MIDLTLRCPVCGDRADMCFAHGDDWKKRTPGRRESYSERLRREGGMAVSGKFAEDEPPPYTSPARRTPQAADPREGIFTVHDHNGNYRGCIGSETWQRLLDDEGGAVA